MGVSYKIIAALRICGKYVAFRSVSFTLDKNSLQALKSMLLSSHRKHMSNRSNVRRCLQCYQCNVKE